MARRIRASTDLGTLVPWRRWNVRVVRWAAGCLHIVDKECEWQTLPGLKSFRQP